MRISKNNGGQGKFVIEAMLSKKSFVCLQFGQDQVDHSRKLLEECSVETRVVFDLNDKRFETWWWQ